VFRRRGTERAAELWCGPPTLGGVGEANEDLARLGGPGRCVVCCAVVRHLAFLLFCFFFFFFSLMEGTRFGAS
jgi:hypothetical protein